MPPDANAPALTRGRVADPVEDRAAVRHTRRRWPFILLVLAAAVAGAVIYQRSRTSQTAASSSGRRPQNQTVPVGVAAASRQDVPVRISALGSVAAFNTVTVRPRVDGQLMRVTFREGQFVTQGDLLAVIDPRPFQVQLEQAEGQLARDQAQLSNAQVAPDAIPDAVERGLDRASRTSRRRPHGQTARGALKVDQRHHRQRASEPDLYASHGAHQRTRRASAGRRRQRRHRRRRDGYRRDHPGRSDRRAVHPSRGCAAHGAAARSAQGQAPCRCLRSRGRYAPGERHRPHGRQRRSIVHGDRATEGGVRQPRSARSSRRSSSTSSCWPTPSAPARRARPWLCSRARKVVRLHGRGWKGPGAACEGRPHGRGPRLDPAG